MSTPVAPDFDIDGFERLLFNYDAMGDIAYLHVDEVRAAVTVDVDDAWYVRLAGNEVVGLELHGLRRIFLSNPFFSKVFTPAIRELEEFTGTQLFSGDADFTAQGSTVELPKTSHLLIFMVGQALARYEAMQRAGYAALSREASSA